MPDLEGPIQDGSSGFSVTVERDTRGVRVRVVGELDLASVPELNSVLETLKDDGYGRLLLDLDGVEFIDSSGLSAIIHAHDSADRSGHPLTIRCSAPQVQKLFELTGMLDYFTFE